MKKIYLAGFVFSAAVLTVVLWFFLASTNSLVREMDLRTLSFNLLERLESVKDQLTYAENARKGYVITGDEEEFAPYYRASKEIETGLRDIRDIVGGRPRQEPRVDLLEDLIRRRMENIEESARVSPLRLERQVRLIEEGEAVQAAIDEVISELIEEEREMFLRLSERSRVIAGRLFAAILAGSVVNFAIFFTIVCFLLKEVKERKKAQEKAAVLNVSLEKELSRTAFLKEVASAASGTLSVKEACARILEVARSYLGAKLGSVYYLDRQKNVLSHIAMFGYPEDRLGMFREIPMEADSFLTHSLRKNLQVISSDTDDWPEGAWQRIRDAGLEKDRWIILPLEAHGKKIGGIVLGFQGKRPFNQEEIFLYRGIAGQIGVSVENALLYEELGRSKTEFEAFSRRYEMILENAAEGIFGLDTGGNHTFINCSAAMMLGYPAAELVGRHSHAVWHHTKPGGRKYPETECPMYKVLRTGEEEAGEDYFVRKDGTFFPVEFSATPIFEDGRIAGAVVTFRDITDRKLAQEALKKSEERFRSIFAQSPIGITLCDERGYPVEANAAAVEIFGASLEDAASVSMFDDPNFPAELAEKAKRGEVVREEKLYDFSKSKFRSRKTGVIYLNTLLTPLVEEAGRPPRGYLIQMQDVTERRRSEEALQRANEDLSRWLGELELRNKEIETLSEMGSLLQACVTAEEAYTVITGSCAKLFPHDSGRVYLLNEQRSLLEAVASWGALDAGELVLTPRECFALRLGKVYAVHGEGGEMPCQHVEEAPSGGYVCVPLVAQGETIGLMHLRFGRGWREGAADERRAYRQHKISVAEAAAESVALSIGNFRLREKLYAQSIHDPLTGLFNRRHMAELLERELHRMGRRGRPLSLIMLDIDHFKRFNDTWGHEAGDTLLKEIAGFLERNIRGGDFACRYGGEEFVLVLPETPLESAGDRAEEIRRDIKNIKVQYRGRVLGPVSLSLGVAAFPRHGISIDALLRAADTALYKAKEEGRDRVAVL